jgi:hypothetical protein
MAKKTVTMGLADRVLGREEKAVTFTIRSGQSKFGELRVSKGALYWKPAKKQSSHKITWEELAGFAQTKSHN